MKLVFLLFGTVLIVSVIADWSNSDFAIGRIDQAQDEIDSQAEEASQKLIKVLSRTFKEIESSYGEMNKKMEKLYRVYKTLGSSIIGTAIELLLYPGRANCQKNFDSHLKDLKHFYGDHRPSRFSYKSVASTYAELLNLEQKTSVQLRKAKDEARKKMLTASDRDAFIQQNVTIPITDLFILFKDFHSMIDNSDLVAEYNKEVSDFFKFSIRYAAWGFKESVNCVNDIKLN